MGNFRRDAIALEGPNGKPQNVFFTNMETGIGSTSARHSPVVGESTLSTYNIICGHNQVSMAHSSCCGEGDLMIPGTWTLRDFTPRRQVLVGSRFNPSGLTGRTISGDDRQDNICQKAKQKK